MTAALALFLSLSSAQAADPLVRVLHLSPDVGAVDVFLDGAMPAVVMDVNFREGTGYLPVPAGLHTFQVAPHRQGVGAAVLDFPLDLVNDTQYSAVAIGDLATLAPLALVDDPVGIAAGEVRFQVVHAAVGIGDVTLQVNGKPLLNRVGFGAAATAELPAGAFELGLDADRDGFVDFTFWMPAFAGGSFVNLFVGVEASGAPFALAWLPDGSTRTVWGEAVAPASLRAVHLSPDAPAVDVWSKPLGGLVLEGLALDQGTGYLEVPAGEHRLLLAANGAPPKPPVAVLRKDLLPETPYTAVAYGALAALQTVIVKDEDGSAAAPGSYRLRVFHAADGVGTVDVLDADTGAGLVRDLAYGACETIDAPAAEILVGLDLDDDRVADFTFTVPALSAGSFVSAFAALDSLGSPYLLAHLPDGSVARIPAN